MTCPETSGPRISFEDQEAAWPMPLRGGPLSPPAHLLVDTLIRDVLIPSGRFADRPTSALKARKALGAMLSDLFDFQAGKGSAGAERPVCGAHGMSMSDFPAKQLGFGQTSFVQVTKALADARMLEVHDGWSRRQAVFDRTFYGKGRVTRFRMTDRLLALATSLGVHLEHWKGNWAHTGAPRVLVPPTVDRLVLKARKVRKGPIKTDGLLLPIDFNDPIPAKIARDIEELNDYLSKQAIGGIAFPGVRRVFNDGDQVDFKWKAGGRYTSLPGGDRYENMPSAERAERIIINGEGVGEVDITACHLSLLYALCGTHFDPSALDPYFLPKAPQLPRAIVKSWLSQALGSGSARSPRWSFDARQRYAILAPGRLLREDIPIASVRDAALDRHPILGSLGTIHISTLNLQYHETEVLRIAIENLRNEWDIPAPPMHDGLITPLRCMEQAAQELENAFAAYIGNETRCPSTVRIAVKRKGP